MKAFIRSSIDEVHRAMLSCGVPWVTTPPPAVTGHLGARRVTERSGGPIPKLPIHDVSFSKCQRFKWHETEYAVHLVAMPALSF
jgi:hypothetical protein